MPRRPPKTCGVCGVKTESGSRCEKHKAIRSDGSRWGWEGGNNNERGYGTKWRKVREQALRRDKYLCVPCFNKGFLTEATEVDHIVNKAQGGDWYDLNNLQSICHDCHKIKTLEEAKNGRQTHTHSST